MHSDHTHVGCAAGNGNSEFKKFIPEDEHSSHSLNSFNSLGYLFTSQHIRETKQFRMSWLLLDLTRLCICFGDFNCPEAQKGGLVVDQSRMTTLFSENSQHIRGQVFGFIVVLKSKRELFHIKMVQLLEKNSYYIHLFQY